MKKTINIYLVASLFVFSACDYEEPDVTLQEFDGTTEEMLRLDIPDASLFLDAMEQAGLTSRLTGSESFTYFAPNNAAFQGALETLGVSSVNEVEPEILADILDAHTVTGIVTSEQLTKSTVTSIDGDLIQVSVLDGVNLNAKAGVVNADNISDNGVVHIINFPLLVFATNTIQDIVETNASDADSPEFTVLNAALNLTGLNAAVDGSDEFTVFAPTDAAFALNGFTLDNIGDTPVEDLTEILSYHVLSSRFFTIDIESGRVFSIQGTAEDGEQGVDIDVSNTSVALDGLYPVSTTSVNLLATNGTIHVVNDLILPKPYIIDAVNFNSLGFIDLSGLLNSSQEQFFVSGMANAFNGASIDLDSIFTTEAVRSIIAPVSTSSDDDVIILNHTFEGSIDLSTEDGNTLTSLNGNRYYVREATDGFNYVNGRMRVAQVRDQFTFPGSDTDTRVLIEDYGSYNGLLTVVNGELTPLPEENAAAIIDADMDADTLSLFNEALQFLELDDESDVTYLFPDNDVFSEAYTAAGIDADPSELEMADEDILTEYVNRHIITSVFFSNELEVGGSVTNRNGTTLNLVSDGESFGILLNDDGDISIVSFMEVDILASNGVIHTVTGILPESEE